MHTTPFRPLYWEVVEKLFPKNWRAFVNRRYKFMLGCVGGLDIYIVHTKGSEASLRSSSPYKKADIRVVSHPVYTTVRPREASPFTAQVRQALKIQSGDVVLIIPGFVAKTKGHLPLISALAMLPAHYKLIIAGGRRSVHKDNYAETLQASIRSSNLQARVCLTGYLEDGDLKSLIGLSTLAVFPYDINYTSTSGIIGMALAQGKCAVVTPTNPFLEMARHTPGMAVARSQSPRHLAQTIIAAVNNPRWTERQIADSAARSSYAAMAGLLDEQVYQDLYTRKVNRTSSARQTGRPA